MRLSRSSRRSTSLLLDMTPMIDIVFLLLIFFLWTMQLVQDARTELDLPEEAGEQVAQNDQVGLIVNLLADGTLIEGDQEISLDRLKTLALSTSGNTTIQGAVPRPLIRADRNAPVERLNQVMNILRQSGLTGIRLATSPSR